MKNIFRFLMSAAILFGAVSCAKEDISSSLAGGEVEVTLSVDVPELGTRAFGDGMTVDQLFIAVYEKIGNTTSTIALPISHIDGEGFQGSEAFSGGRATVTMVLLKDKTYDLVFWAQKSGTGAYDVNLANGRNIEANYGALCNLEDRDAFFFIRNNWTAGAQGAETEFKLNRPFAQINVANSNADVDFVTANGATIETSALTVNTKVANVLDMKTGDVNGSVDVAFAANAIPTEAFHIAGYNYLAMNYLLVKDKELVNLEFVFTDDEGVAYTREYGNVPVQRNYRTNILGQIISSPIDFTVVIDPIFNEVEHEYEVTPWDGKTATEPAYDATTQTYTVSNGAELAWIAGVVNGTISRATADPLAGHTIVLANDIDLSNMEWTPIGSAYTDHGFMANFNGNGYSIKNLNITNITPDADGYVYAGLFGVTEGTETEHNFIKNLVIENVNINLKGHIAAAVVAYPYYTDLDNITVKGKINIVAQDYTAGVVSYTRRCVKASNLTIAGDEGSVITGRNTIGGVISDIQLNGGLTAQYSNFKASGLTITGAKCVGGIAGIISLQTLNGATAENVQIVCDNLYNGKAIGSLGGNSVINELVVNNVTGANNLVGAQYGDVAGAIVTINGVEYKYLGEGVYCADGIHTVFSIEGLQLVLDAVAGNLAINLGADLEGDVMEFQKADETVVIDGCGHKFNGTIKIHNGSSYVNGTMLIKNVNFETATEGLNFVMPNDFGAEEGVTRRYSNNVTVSDCTFTATGAAVGTAVGVQAKTCYNLQVLNCTANGLHSLIQAQSCTENVEVHDCVVNGKNGVAFKQVKAAVVEGTTINAAAYGIRFDGNTDNYGIVVENNNVTAAQPLIVRKMTGKNNTIALVGQNTLTTNADYQIVITNGSDDAAYSFPKGTYTLIGAEGFKVYPGSVVAESKEGFEDALATADVNTVTLSTDISYGNTEDITIEKDFVINGEGKKIVAGGASSLTPSIAVMGKYNTAINNANVEGGFVGAYYGANVTFNGGSLKFTDGMSGRNCFYAAGTDANQSVITIIDADVNMANASGNSYLCAHGNAVIYVKGGNFYGKPVGSSNPYVKEAAYGSYTGEVIISGGTFNFDPTEWLAAGYKATKSGDNWVVSAE